MVTKTLDMHQPYPYTGFSWNEMPDKVRSNTFITVRGVYWVDKTLEHFFKEAQKRGLMDDRTLFIITSDHNPHSGGEYTKLVTKAEDKQSIAPIPLIFVSKNLAPLNNLRTNEYASQIDLAPTLLYLLGIDVPENSWAAIFCSVLIFLMPWATLAVRRSTGRMSVIWSIRWISLYRIQNMRML